MTAFDSSIANDIQKYFKMDEKNCEAFMAGESDAKVAWRILSWQKGGIPPGIKISWGGLQKIKARFQHVYYMSRIVESQWGKETPDKVKTFLETVGGFELWVIFEVNPFYPLLAFDLSYKLCSDLIHLCEIPIPAPAQFYALICNEITIFGGCSKERHDELKKKYSLTGNILHLKPFGADILKGHVFEDIDVEATPAAHVTELLPKGQSFVILMVIRERKFLCNRIVFNERSKKYIMKNRTSSLVAHLRCLNKKI